MMEHSFFHSCICFPSIFKFSISSTYSHEWPGCLAVHLLFIGKELFTNKRNMGKKAQKGPAFLFHVSLCYDVILTPTAPTIIQAIKNMLFRSLGS
jgi:hypothetical protein